jgi:hypothetical protein
MGTVGVENQVRLRGTEKFFCIRFRYRKFKALQATIRVMSAKQPRARPFSQ